MLCPVAMYSIILFLEKYRTIFPCILPIIPQLVQSIQKEGANFPLWYTFKEFSRKTEQAMAERTDNLNLCGCNAALMRPSSLSKIDGTVSMKNDLHSIISLFVSFSILLSGRIVEAAIEASDMPVQIGDHSVDLALAYMYACTWDTPPMHSADYAALLSYCSTINPNATIDSACYSQNYLEWWTQALYAYLYGPPPISSSGSC